MKKLLTVLFLLFASQVFSQTDKNGNPVFNSVTTDEETIGDFLLISSYYTLKNNIADKTSSVFISDSPTLDQVEQAATNLPSDFFMIRKDSAVLNMIMLMEKPARQYFVVNPATGKNEQFPCTLKGDITENRAREIVEENYDQKARIKGHYLYFNDKKLRIISNADIRKDVLALIEKQEFNKGQASNMKLLSNSEIKKLVLEESKDGGKLDFFTEIKGHEYDGIQVKPGVFSTKLGVALYKWGRANFELGVNTVKDALQLWEEHKGRPANQREESYITMGFKKELEK
jgi:hypothetical protein